MWLERHCRCRGCSRKHLLPHLLLYERLQLLRCQLHGWRLLALQASSISSTSTAEQHSCQAFHRSLLLQRLLHKRHTC
jgi:hypothetical protein